METERFEVIATDGRTLEAIAAGPEDGTHVLTHHGTPGSAREFWPPHLEAAAARGLRLENVAGAEAHLLDDHGHLSLALARFGDILDELVHSAERA